MIGQKGLPATFGGIERHVEELGARLADNGHEVTVYCRSSYATVRVSSYRGMRLSYVPTAGTKHLDAIVHSAVSTLAAAVTPPDIIHYHALGPGLVAPIPRYLFRSKVVLTVHGLDHERDKWGPAARGVLAGAHWMSARVPDATVVVSNALAAHYSRTFGRRAIMIPNGVDPPVLPREPGELLQRLGLRARAYVLFVGRLVKEKAPHDLVRAYRTLDTDFPLVIAGDSSFTDDYIRELRQMASGDRRILFPGYVYGDVLAALYAEAAAFVLPSMVEGLPLTLLEACSHGTPVVASDIPAHIEVLVEDGPGHRLFPQGNVDALSRTLAMVLDSQPHEREGSLDMRRRVLTSFRWERAASLLESVYMSLSCPGPRD